MNIDEFVRAVASEPMRVVTLRGRIPTVETLALASKPGGVSLQDFTSSPAKVEERHLRFGHVLGSPARPEAIYGWQTKWPSHRLPGDLIALLERVNGIHLWADLDVGRSYLGLAPIEEWNLARVKMYGSEADQELLDDRYIALTYHEDGTSFVVVDVSSGTYYLMDVAGPDDSTPLGKCVDDLLDWLWKNRIPPPQC